MLKKNMIILKIILNKTNITFNIKGEAELSQFHPFLHLVDKSETWVSQLSQQSKMQLVAFFLSCL